MKRVALLGSTGSIGRNVLDVVSKNRDRFQIALLSCRKDATTLIEQARAFNCPTIHMIEDGEIDNVRQTLPSSTKVFIGSAAIEEIIASVDADIIVNAIVGFAGLAVSYHALKAGMPLALANKESLVAGGELLNSIRSRTGAPIIPIDSEHSAIFQCLQSGKRDEVEKIILTASGGPFRSRLHETFGEITVEEALKHPNWSMGNKVTIDSATMMNKGLEVIEAHFLFDLRPGQIEIVIHPESIIHSMVQFVDGSVIAQMSPPDMRVPISYALSYPDRLSTDLQRTDFSKLRRLTFESPDHAKFPALKLAYHALARGGLAPLVLNAANEVAVDSFLSRKIRFTDITNIVDAMLERDFQVETMSLEFLLQIDRAVRKQAGELVNNGTFQPSRG